MWKVYLIARSTAHTYVCIQFGDKEKKVETVILRIRKKNLPHWIKSLEDISVHFEHRTRERYHKCDSLSNPMFPNIP